MKVVIVLNTAWNAYNFRSLIVKNLLKNGHQVSLISPYDEYVEILNEWGVRHIHVSLEKSGLNPLKDFEFYRKLKKEIRKEHPQVVLSYTIKPNIYASFAANALGIPIICNVSGLGTTFLWKGWIKRLATFMYRRAFKKSDFIFFQNQDDQKLLVKNLNLNKTKTGLLPGSGINLESFRPSKKSSNESFTFLMISRLLIDKGVLEYIKASEIVKNQYPNCKIQLVGGYDSEHKRSIGRKDFDLLNEKSPIEYLGETNDVRLLIENASCIVLPSYREGTPRTLLEGAAMAKPLIASDVPGCRDVVRRSENGFLCEKENVSSLAECMVSMLRLSPEHLTEFGTRSRNIVEAEFDESLVWEKYWEKIQELVTP